MKLHRFATQVLLGLSVTAMFFGHPAQASAQNYRWVPLSEEQLDKLRSQCGISENPARAAIGLTSVAVAPIGFAKAVTGMLDSTGGGVDFAVLLVATMVGAVSGVAVYAGMENLSAYMSPDDIYLLIQEQQFGQPGLMTERLRTLATESGVSPDQVLQQINLALTTDFLCARSITQIAEAMPSVEQAKRSAQLQQEAERLAKEEVARAQRDEALRAQREAILRQN